jgi:ribulose-phosphate 3-epimerase
MSHTIEIVPSLYHANFARLGAQVDDLLRAGARVFHFDIADGHFIPEVTFGPVVVRSLAPIVHARRGMIDCHMLVDNPVRHFGQIADAGGDRVTFHVEAVTHVAATVAAARKLGLQVGLACRPDTPVEAVVAAATAGTELVLLAEPHVGELAQVSAEHVRQLRRALPDDVAVHVECQGDDSRIRGLRDAGASVFVCGKPLFESGDPSRAYSRLVHLLAKALT